MTELKNWEREISNNLFLLIEEICLGSKRTANFDMLIFLANIVSMVTVWNELCKFDGLLSEVIIRVYFENANNGLGIRNKIKNLVIVKLHDWNLA